MTGRVLAAALAFAWAWSPAWGENLLRNAGFEDDDGERPSYWSVFVQPMFGAEGAVDSEVAAEGFRSVRLHTPEPYGDEPANNWSQNVQADAAGKRLRLEGAIRTAKADYAAIWIQACTKRPFRILQQDSTFDLDPVRGDRGWTRVGLTVTVPENTEFFVVRCVIQGAGTAWFDDLSLVVEAPAVQDSAAIDAPVASIEPTAPISIVRPSTPAPTRPIVEAPTAPSVARPESIAASELVELNTSLQDTVQDLRETNDAIADELDAHRAEIERLKSDMIILRDALVEANRAAQAAAESQVRRATPPLVPGGDPNGGERP